jgi:hypothetical protein
MSDEDFQFFDNLAEAARMPGWRNVDTSYACFGLLEPYKPNRQHVFTIIREFLENTKTYGSEQIREHTEITAMRIASAYRPHNVVRAIETILEYLTRIVLRSSPETSETIQPDELVITDTINDLLTWLNDLDNCGDVEVVYVDNYPVTVSNDAISVLDRLDQSGGIDTSLLKIVTPVYGLDKKFVLYTGNLELPQARHWFKNMLQSDNGWKFNQWGFSREGKTIENYLDEITTLNTDRFPLHRFWFVLDENNQVVAILGYLGIMRENGPRRLWGFGYPKRDKDGTPYLQLLFGCLPESDCYDYAEQILNQNGWKLVTSCSPAFNPYDPGYGLFWRLMDDVELRAANQPKEVQNERKTLLKKRSPNWTKQNPFGVFQVIDTDGLKRAGYTKFSNKRAILGYWPSEQDANSVMKIILASDGEQGYVSVEKIKPSELNAIAQNGYKTVNGLENKNWWNVSDSEWERKI